MPDHSATADVDRPSSVARAAVITENTTPIVSVERLSHTYRHAPHPALSDLALTIHPGEIVALVGHNGAGKTTFLRVLTGLLRPIAGDISVAGHPLYREGARGRAEMAAAKRLMGSVADTPTLYERLTGREFVRFLAGFYGIAEGPALEQRIAALFAFFRLDDQADQRIATYSLGMKKKIAVCAALIHDPAMIILDEPFDGLDPAARLCLKDALRAAARRGRAILLSTHGLEVAEDLSTRIVVIHHGRIIADGDMAYLRHLAGADNALNLEGVFFRLTGQGELNADKDQGSPSAAGVADGTIVSDEESL